MIAESVYIDFLNNLVEGNKRNCSLIVNNLLNCGTDVKEIYMDLIQKSMYRIGQMWDRHKISIAQEHIASQIIENLLSQIYPRVVQENRNSKSVVIACLDKEFHEIGARMVSDYFELNGWHSLFLGANTPNEDLIDIVKIRRPDVVGISINFYINVCRLTKLLDEITRKFPDQKIILGGQAINENHIELINKFHNVTYLTCLNALEEYIKDFY